MVASRQRFSPGRVLYELVYNILDILVSMSEYKRGAKTDAYSYPLLYFSA